ncbi:phage tail protein [Paramagnetospirillum magneticum]|uniref:Uncharacterized protein n=1 Tax=Paramagnetospirillum magneticum (strain ATCC 700264 / AMB-1) TaxID=342108 RepID=Q2WA44_PARM1|nr:phage tail protein [Paramagnetospirillum magneticum]BAE49281.1 hypothetical protein amb0477 [Paramagnetospirillum magneticum AMB-1]
MAGIFSSPKSRTPQAQQPTAAAGVQIQTSAYGKAVALVFGTTKVAPNLVWYGDFQSIAHSSGGGGGGGGGGKGGGGGDSGGGSTTYTYKAAFAFGLCEGPIKGVGRAWAAKTETTPAALNLSVFTGAYPQLPWTYLESHHGEAVERHTVPTHAPYTVTVNYPAPPFTDSGVVDEIDGRTFTATAVAPGVGQYSVANGTYTFSAADAGIELRFTYTSGNQQPANQALGYNGLAYVASPDYDLGDSPNLPNHNFEVQGIYSDSVDGAEDADASLVVRGLLTDRHWGLGNLMPADLVGDQALYRDYVLASGLLISPAYSEQQTAAQMIEDIGTYTNADVAWTGTFNMLPRCHEVVTGNGVTYTPPETVFDLGDDDWMDSSDAITASGTNMTDPVVLVRARPADAINQVTLEYLNRANQYSPEPVTARDVAAIRAYGLNQDKTRQAHLFTTGTVARLSAQLLLQRQAARNKWQGTVGEEHVLLDVGDTGFISNARLRLNRQLVRIEEITDNDDGSRAMVFEEILSGAGVAAAHTFAEALGSAPSYNVDPGDCVTPIFFDAPTELTGGLEVWMATAGGDQWAGAQVWISSNDESYARAGTVTGDARMGALSAPLDAGADPDNDHTLSVDLAKSGGQLGSGTREDADALNTLCWVDGELVAYQTATLTGVDRYDLTYLRRGAFGTTVADHAADSRFVRVDRSLFRYSYTKDQIGKPVHVKLLSYNLFGGGVQTISQVSAHTYVIQGPPLPPAVTGFGAQQQGNVVTFHWSPLNNYAVDIAYGPKGCTDGVTVDQAWAAMSMLTESARGTEMTNASVPPGNWTFAIRARNTFSDQLSPTLATVDLVVTNAQIVLDGTGANLGPDWLGGDLQGLVRHWTGKLVPQSRGVAVDDGDTTWEFCPNPVAAPVWTGPAIDTGTIDDIRIWATVSTSLGPGNQGNVSTTFAMDWSTTGADWNGTYQPWTVGSVHARYIRPQLRLDTSLGGCLVTGFVPVADVPLKSETITATVPAGGGWVAFSKPYHAPPAVNPGAAGAGLTSASAVDVTAYGCTVHAWSGANDVGGPVVLTIGPSP